MSYVIVPAKEPAARWDREYQNLDDAKKDAEKLSFDLNCTVAVAEIVGRVIRETKWQWITPSAAQGGCRNG